MSRKGKSLLAVAVIALVAGLLPITLASAAPTKIYDLTMSPTSLAADTGGQTITATFKNATPSGNSSINSLKLFATAPAGFQITAATGIGTEDVRPDGQSVFVSNIPPIKNGKTYVLTMTVTTQATDCSGGSITWTASPGGVSNVYTGSNFAGDTFAQNTVSGTTTSVSVACSLSFTQQPTDALKNTAIVPAIAVTGSPASLFANEDVTLKVAGNSPTAGSLDVTVAADGNGVATFSNVSFATSGDYKLVATSGDFSTGSSDTFTISDGILGCDPDNNTATTTGVSVVRLPNADGSDCVLIPYILDRNGDQIAFLKDLTVQTEAQFQITVDSWDAEDAVLPLPITQVDTPGGFHNIQWCLGTSLDPSILPGTEVTCLLDQSATVQADGKVKVNETYFLYGDILYKR
jgi:hypothetical protein